MFLPKVALWISNIFSQRWLLPVENSILVGQRAKLAWRAKTGQNGRMGGKVSWLG